MDDQRVTALQAILIRDIIDELERAEAKHPGWPTDLCHQAMILNEEVGEVNQAILNYVEWRKHLAPEAFDLGSVHDIDEQKSSYIDKEMVQVAAMAIRFLYNWRINDRS